MASGFKQLCLGMEENLSGKWEGPGRAPRAEERRCCQLMTEVGLWEGRRDEGTEGSGRNPAAFFLVTTLHDSSENQESFYPSRLLYPWSAYLRERGFPQVYVRSCLFVCLFIFLCSCLKKEYYKLLVVPAREHTGIRECKKLSFASLCFRGRNRPSRSSPPGPAWEAHFFSWEAPLQPSTARGPGRASSGPDRMKTLGGVQKSALADTFSKVNSGEEGLGVCGGAQGLNRRGKLRPFLVAGRSKSNTVPMRPKE